MLLKTFDEQKIKFRFACGKNQLANCKLRPANLIPDMFERKRVNIGCLQKVIIGAKEPECMDVRKKLLVEQIRGGHKWSRDHGEKKT